MKKTYINPELEVVLLSMNQSLLAGSELGVGEKGSANNAEGRFGDIDFDDDEEY